MRLRFPALFALAVILAPAAASAQYYDGGFDRRESFFHVDRYRHGDYEDVVIHRPRRDYDDRAFYERRRFREDRPFFGERRVYGEFRHHHHHYDDY